VREDWALVDFARGFMPNWLAKLTSLTFVGVVTLALIVLVVVLKVLAA